MLDYDRVSLRKIQYEDEIVIMSKEYDQERCLHLRSVKAHMF